MKALEKGRNAIKYERNELALGKVRETTNQEKVDGQRFFVLALTAVSALSWLLV